MARPGRKPGIAKAHINAMIPLELEKIARDQAAYQRRTLSAMVSEALLEWARSHGHLADDPPPTP
jgi:hypothetical protein